MHVAPPKEILRLTSICEAKKCCRSDLLHNPNTLCSICDIPSSIYFVGWIPHHEGIDSPFETCRNCLEFFVACFDMACGSDNSIPCCHLPDEGVHHPTGMFVHTLEVVIISLYFIAQLIPLENTLCIICVDIIGCNGPFISSNGLSLLTLESFHVGMVPRVFTPRHLQVPSKCLFL